jgi:hypothetical protein
MTESHPLFLPATEDDEAPEVTGILVSRMTNGRYAFCRKKFSPEELTELSQLYEMFGGGDYELHARNSSHVTARRKYLIDGKSRPLNPEEDAPAAVPTIQPVPQAAAGSGNILQLVIALAPLILQWLQMQSAAQAAAQQAQTQMLLAVVNKGDTNSQAHVQAMTSLHQSFSQSQATLFGQVVQAMREHGGEAGEGGGGGFMNGVEWMGEFMKESFAKQAEGGGESDDKTLETLSQFLSTAMQAAQHRPAQTPPNGQPPPGQPVA